MFRILCLTLLVGLAALGLPISGASQDPGTILNIQHDRLNEDRELTINANECLFKISSPNAATTTRLLKDLRLTGNVDDLTAQNNWIKPTADGNTVAFTLCSFLESKDEATLIFLNNGSRVSTLKLTKREPAAASTGLAISPLPAIDILNGVSYPAVASVSAPNEYRSKQTSIYYSLCENKIYWYNDKKLRPRIGESFNFVLNPVPNQYRYDIELSSKYLDYNTETNDLLEESLLSAGKNIPTQQSAGVTDETKALALAYLRKINFQLAAFINQYKALDCIDVEGFKTNKAQILSNIASVLIGETSFNSTGDLEDLIRVHFVKKDSSIYQPYLETYRQFLAMDFNTVRYTIPKLQNFDELRINMKIKPKKDQGGFIFVDSTISQSLYGGFKVDVSPGIFYSSLGGQSFTLRADSTVVPGSNGADSVTGRDREIVRESGNKGNLVFGTLMHFYSRWGQDVNLAASIGVGLTLDSSPEIQYLGGLSILFGRVNRLSISGGIAIGKVTRLSDRYLEGSGYRRVNFNETELSTKKLLKTGWFLGIGYNIPLLKRKSSNDDAKK